MSRVRGAVRAIAAGAERGRKARRASLRDDVFGTKRPQVENSPLRVRGRGLSGRPRARGRCGASRRASAGGGSRSKPVGDAAVNRRWRFDPCREHLCCSIKGCSARGRPGHASAAASADGLGGRAGRDGFLGPVTPGDSSRADRRDAVGGSAAASADALGPAPGSGYQQRSSDARRSTRHVDHPRREFPAESFPERQARRLRIQHRRHCLQRPRRPCLLRLAARRRGDERRPARRARPRGVGDARRVTRHDDDHRPRDDLRPFAAGVGPGRVRPPAGPADVESRRVMALENGTRRRVHLRRPGPQPAEPGAFQRLGQFQFAIRRARRLGRGRCQRRSAQRLLGARRTALDELPTRRRRMGVCAGAARRRAVDDGRRDNHAAGDQRPACRQRGRAERGPRGFLAAVVARAAMARDGRSFGHAARRISHVQPLRSGAGGAGERVQIFRRARLVSRTGDGRAPAAGGRRVVERGRRPDHRYVVHAAVPVARGGTLC